MKRTLGLAALMASAVFMTATAKAAVIFETDLGTGFNSTTNLFINSSFGAAATLTFTPNGPTSSGVPSNVNYGTFSLSCAACSPQSLGAGAAFTAFTFNLKVTDTTDGATGIFVGTSTGGSVFLDASTIAITWSPLVLGPGTTNATTGNFGTSIFDIPSGHTDIVNPTSGAAPGVTTVQGTLSSSAIPEPMTLSLVGGSLLGLGIIRRKRLFR